MNPTSPSPAAALLRRPCSTQRGSSQLPPEHAWSSQSRERGEQPISTPLTHSHAALRTWLALAREGDLARLHRAGRSLQCSPHDIVRSWLHLDKIVEMHLSRCTGNCKKCRWFHELADVMHFVRVASRCLVVPRAGPSGICRPERRLDPELARRPADRWSPEVGPGATWLNRSSRASALRTLARAARARKWPPGTHPGWAR